MKKEQKFGVWIIGLLIFACMGIALSVTAEGADEEPGYVVEFRNGNFDKADALFWELVDFSQVGKGYGASEQMDMMLYGLQFIPPWYEVLNAEQYDFAVTLCDEAIEKLPTNYKGFRSYLVSLRAEAWEKKGVYDKAIEDYEMSNSFRSLAMLLATCSNNKYRDGEKAVQYAKRAIADAKEDSPTNFEALAAASAEAGNFQEAVSAQEKAIALLIAEQEEALAKLQDETQKEDLKKRQENIRAQYAKHLELYKAEEPLRFQ